MHAAWPALLVLLTALPAAGAAEPEGESVSCGNMAPLGNSCDAGEVRLGTEPSAEAVAAPFVGRITIEARQTVPEPPFYAFVRWTCVAAGFGGTATCEPPEKEGRLAPGLMAHVTCRASAHPSLMAPPLGVWGCVVDPGNAPP